MGSHNNLSAKFKAILFSSGWMRHIIFPLSTSVFSLENQGSKSDSSLILLSRICYQKILISKHHDIIRPIDQDFIFPDKQLSGHLAFPLFRYPIGCICNRLFSLHIGLSMVLNYPLRNDRSFHFPNTSPLSEQRRVGACGEQSPFMEHLCWRPPCDGRFSIALSLTLAGQKGPIFPKKIGASGGWAEPHLLAFTVP